MLLKPKALETELIYIYLYLKEKIYHHNVVVILSPLYNVTVFQQHKLYDSI